MAALELRHGRADRWALRGDRESQWDDHPTVVDVAPTVSEMAEEHLKADVNLPVMHDRHVHCKPWRALDAAVPEPRDHARI